MDLSNFASALGLYKYECDNLDKSLFGRFYTAIISQMQSWGVTPTYVGAEGVGYSGKLSKVGSRTHNKMVKTNFVDVNVLSLVVNALGSVEPSFDNFISASLSYIEANRELLACIVVNEAFVKIHSSKFDGLLRTMIDLCPWSFGYGFSSSVEKQPDFHILGLDNGKLSTEEYKSLCTWYATQGNVRAVRLRDVYSYNILNENQLDSKVSEGVTLRQLVQNQPDCSITRLTDYGLYLWQVPDSEIARMRKTLIGSPVLIS